MGEERVIKVSLFIWGLEMIELLQTIGAGLGIIAFILVIQYRYSFSSRKRRILEIEELAKISIASRARVTDFNNKIENAISRENDI